MSDNHDLSDETFYNPGYKKAQKKYNTHPNTDSRELDTIQRNIWARINDEVNLRGIKLSIGDAYALGSVIKEVLHPQVLAYTANKQAQAVTELLDLLDKWRDIPGGMEQVVDDQREQLKNKKESL